jgi:hypothetical protein
MALGVAVTRFVATGWTGAHRDSSSMAAGSGRWGTDGVCLHRRPSGSLAGPESNMVLVGCLWRKHSGNSVAGGGCTR